MLSEQPSCQNWGTTRRPAMHYCNSQIEKGGPRDSRTNRHQNQGITPAGGALLIATPHS
jgi:hypothetical protein